jgi:hypothetical protein
MSNRLTSEHHGTLQLAASQLIPKNAKMQYDTHTLDLAAVGIEPIREDLLIEIQIVGVNSSVEGDRDHLRHLVRLQVPGNPGVRTSLSTNYTDKKESQIFLIYKEI